MLKTLIAVLSIGSIALASPVVTYTLEIDPSGSFEVSALVSAGDNAGLAMYGVEFVGFDTLVNLGPRLKGLDQVDQSTYDVGFNLFRSAGDDPQLGGSQNTITGTIMAFGIGQSAGDLHDVLGPLGNPTDLAGTVQPVYGAEVLLASGTYSGQSPAWGQASSANVFVNDTSTQVVPASVVRETVILNPMPGDANGDGCVDDLDLTALAVNWQQATDLWEDGDFNGDGIVDDLDLTALAVNWQQGCGGGGSFAEALATNGVIPEPACALLIMAGAAAAMLRRSKSASRRSSSVR